MYIFAKISVCYKPYCVYIFAQKKLSKQGCVTVAEVPQRRQKIQSKTKQGNRRKVAWRDVRPKFRKARDTVEAKRSRVFLRSVTRWCRFRHFVSFQGCKCRQISAMSECRFYVVLAISMSFWCRFLIKTKLQQK